eukprot:TRINITY_DN3235_c0_g1_i1.p1 TRINITY_DN3235_c0_g1~~TRINITY_DN3235_c0_g1_i1.p1  ORF type:complete len:713 (+),score=176.35 TRINITY_DN3235_c0_g1_i1:100-2139(+)
MGEEKVPLRFVIGSRKFGYTGYASRRQQDFYEMFYKCGGSDSSASELFKCYQQNFPGGDGEKDEIYDEYKKVVSKQNKKKEDKKKKEKKEKTEEKSSTKDKDRDRERKEKKKSKERRERSRDRSRSRSSSRSRSTSRERSKRDRQREKDRKEWEREQAEKQVQQDKVVDDLLRNFGFEHRKSESKPAPEPAPPSPKVQTPVKAANTIQIKVAMDTSDSQKMLSFPIDVNYDVFLQETIRKCKLDEADSWLVYFLDEDNDRVEIDDTDTLEMYINFVLSQGPSKKGKVFVSKVVESKNAMDAEEDTVNECPNPPATTSNNDANNNSNSNSTAAKSSTSPAVKGTKKVEEEEASEEEEDPKLAMYKESFPKLNQVRSYIGHKESTFCCCFRKRGKQFATSSKDGSIRVWDTEEDRPTKEVLNAYDGSVLSCDYSEDGSLLVSSSNDKSNKYGMKLYSGTSLKKKGVLKGHSQKVYCAKFVGSGASRVASASCDKTVKLWDVEKSKAITKMQGHTSNIFALAVSSCGKKLATGDDDKVIKIWECDKGTCVGSLHPPGIVWSVAFSEDGTRLAAGTMKPKAEEKTDEPYAHLVVYDLNTFKIVKQHFVADSVQHVEFIQNDNILASCGRDKAVSFWDGEDYSLRYHHNIGQKIYRASFHGDRFLTSALSGEVTLWDLPDLSKP